MNEPPTAELIASVARGLAPPRPTPPCSLEPARCPLCDADDAEHLFDGRDHNFGFAGVFPVVRCRPCGMIYNHPRVPPAEIGHFYADDYAAHDADLRARSVSAGSDEDECAATAVAGDRPRAKGPSDAAPPQSKTEGPESRISLLAARHSLWSPRSSSDVAPFGGRRLLDLGCGGGEYLARMQAHGWTVLGVEPVARAVESCRALGVPVLHGTIPGIDLDTLRFDFMTLRGSLANLPDPVATLRLLRQHAADRSLLVANAFNADAWLARRCGPLWTGWDLPREYGHYTPDTLRRLLETTGWSALYLTFRRRPTIARRTARVMALATGRPFWRFTAERRWMTSAMSTWATLMRASDEIRVMARASTRTS